MVDIRQADSIEMQEVAMMVNCLGTMTMVMRQDANGEADPNEAGKLATALTMLAGALVGELIGCGFLPVEQTDEAVDSATGNFRAGIEVGLAKVARIAKDERITH